MKENEIIANIKSLGIDMIDQAGVGHPGIVLSAAPIVYTLYANHLRVNSSDDKWFNRDRFVMSAGHGSALLYATLFYAGFNLNLDDLKHFRHLRYKTPGHPELDKTPGIDCSTGLLGQGIANSIGMALGEKILHEKYRIDKNNSLIDYRVYALVGDGDLMEGISYEAASLAGTLGLNNLIVLYDSNNCSLDGSINNTFTENVRDRFKSMGWKTLLVKNGNNSFNIDLAIRRAKKSSKPVFIEIKTTIGNDSLLAGTNKIHGTPLTKDDISQLKQKLNIPNEPFYINNDNLVSFRNHIASRVDKDYKNWNINYQNYVNNISDGNKTTANYLINNDFNYNLLSNDWDLNKVKLIKESLRDSNMEILAYLFKNIKTFIGGNADVANSTKCYISEAGDINSSNFLGGNIHYGVREHAMGAITNGLALSSLKPYCSTFLSFADYLKPAMRMSALMHLPVTYIFTHDSILNGSDGPTHQPIEQLAMIRAIPNMKVYRPADKKELIGCWQSILNSNHNPSSLILSREKVDLMTNTDSKETTKGGYILYREGSPLKLVLISCGTELHVAKNLFYDLINIGIKSVRLVSMPSIQLFKEQSLTYQQTIIPDGVRVIAIEAGISDGWQSFITNKNDYLVLNSFGISGSKDEILQSMNFDYDSLKKQLFSLLNIDR